jgi:DNA-binding transcriptional ArsR family regulator
MTPDRSLKDPAQVARARRRIGRHVAQVSVEQVQKVVCDPARLHIVQALSEGALCVDDLAATVDRAPAATSQHLRVLRELGLVEGHRRGTIVQYRLRSSPAAEHLEAVLKELERPPELSS